MTKNRLTLFVSKDHAFVGLDCDSCADGKPAHIKAGYYPEASDWDRCEYQCPEMPDNDDPNPSLEKVMQMQSFMGKVQCTQALNNPKIIPSKLTLFSVLRPSQNYNILNEDPEEAVAGKSKCDGEESGINFVWRSGYSEKAFEAMHSASHPIGDADAENIYDEIKLMAETCVPGSEYQTIGNNCIDFTRKMADISDDLRGKSLTKLYGLNPVASSVGLNGVSGAYMLARDIYRAMGSSPVVAYFAAWTLYKTYSWATNKLSRCLGMPFDPKNISKKQRKKHVAKICKARALLKDAIATLKGPFNFMLELTNANYGVAGKRDEYLQLRSIYYSIRHQMRVCEKRLEQVEQLSSDYASLSTNYCSTSFANKVLYSINSILENAIIVNQTIKIFASYPPEISGLSESTIQPQLLSK